MIERDKEYYNQKISELYSIIENQEKIIRDLQEENIRLNNILNIIEQHCLDEQMPEEYLEYSAFVEVQNMVYEEIHNKIQELKGGNNE